MLNYKVFLIYIYNLMYCFIMEFFFSSMASFIYTLVLTIIQYFNGFLISCQIVNYLFQTQVLDLNLVY